MKQVKLIFQLNFLRRKKYNVFYNEICYFLLEKGIAKIYVSKKTGVHHSVKEELCIYNIVPKFITFFEPRLLRDEIEPNIRMGF